ncbi:hypothetical protein DL764_005480 [Monosporascus ibericus]|uniref:Major facilitator superfamily (MFS) profile domain-containing protein n=1 Tax=Monosporascus ibericus TaxID=155417 RepID=A0A4Q4TBM7_9PEZI|nr:hypothetical protein DL764_005480 [Monosporascus ibericus]
MTTPSTETLKPDRPGVAHAEHGLREEFEKVDAVAAAPETTFESFAHLDEKRKDIRLIPMLAALYLLSFLDRGNIGNAKIEGLQGDLRMTPDEYSWCLTAFFFTYAAFEVPSNLLLKKLRPSRWLPCIMIAWGTVMPLMGLVRYFRASLAARLFLGLTEAGLFPGCAALFFSAASVAGAFSGLLAFAIAKMDGVANLEGWRWIFLLEGVATVVIAVIAFFVLHDFPETATFLTEEERAFVVFRLKYQGQVRAEEQKRTQAAQAEEFEWRYVWDAFKDWQIWVNIFVYWGIVCPLYGISLFLPTIIRNLGYSSSKAQLMIVPIYITAAILAVFFAYISDRLGKRSPFVVSFLLIMIVGFSMVHIHVEPPSRLRRRLRSRLAFPGVITWLANNLAGSYKRSAGMAIQIGVGNLGGAVASNFYRQKDAPRYILGHALELAFIGAGVVAAIILIVAYAAINKKRDRAVQDGGQDRYTAAEPSAKGDRAVTFRYIY